MKELAGCALARSIIRLLPCCFERFWLCEAINCAVILITTRLGNDVDNAALRLAILWLESRRLNLNFFYEGGIDASTERAKDARKRANAAEGRVSDVYTASNVQVVESRA